MKDDTSTPVKSHELVTDSLVKSALVGYRLNGSEFDASYVAKLNPLQPVSSFTEVLEEMFGRETDVC
ncbi:hypothetical protein Avbf_07001, partial [Armadillidium vulgare]